MNNEKLSFRQLRKGDNGALQSLLYEALYVKKNAEPFPKSIIYTKELSKYHENWGRSGDFGIVAIYNDEIIGGSWSRIYSSHDKSYGFIDENTPELNIAIFKKYQNQGLGSILIKKHLEILKNEYEKVSLSVDQENTIWKWYQRLGFEIVNEVETAYTMLKHLK